MTFEELKKEAEKQGYTLSKKIKYEKLQKCCGKCPQPQISLSPKGKYYYCKHCGLKSELANSWYMARSNWNKTVEKLET